MKNNAALKKHHFWILAGLAPVLAVLAVVFLMTNAGGAATAALAEQEKKLGEVKGVQPKGTLAIEDWGKQKAKLLVQREKLWEAAWDQQKALFTWPGKEPLLKAMEARYPKFGSPMVASNSEFDLFKRKEGYEDTYAEMAKAIAPTTFRGDQWQRVLRHVSNWGDKIPTDKQVWLALEDMWIQRGLLQPINVINAEATTFTPAGEPKNEAPYTAKFNNRIWDLTLEIATITEGSQRGDVLKAKLTNKTDRLQLLGRGNMMQLLVTLGGRGQPILLRIHGDFVKAGETLDVKPELKIHRLPPGINPAPPTAVRMVPDGKILPVRRVETIELGFKDARHFPATLKSPEWWPDPDPSTMAADPLAAGGFPMGGFGAETGTPGPPPGAPPGAFGAAGGTTRRAGGKIGPPEVVLDANKARYLDITKQVRRMPVAVVLLVDQMFLQDALAAYTNSALRFQITQFHWKRYRGGAGGGSDAGGMYPPGGEMGSGYPGEMAGGFPGGESGFPGDAGGFPGGESGFPGGESGIADPLASSGYPPGGDPSGGYGLSSGDGYTLPPGGFGESYPGAAGGGTTSRLTEGQDTSGLVELTIYGIVTLYEKFEKEAPADGTMPPTDAPTDETPKP